MRLTEAMEIAVASLWAHKLRSVLTLLGVVMGVGSVIAVVSFVNGLNGYIAEKVFNLGADVFIVSRGPMVQLNIEDFLETQKRRKLEMEHFRAVQGGCTKCVLVGASVRQRAEVKYGMNYLRDVTLSGWSAGMARILDIEAHSGRLLTETDELHRAPVCVIGWDVVENLFPGLDPLGKELRINGDPFVIVGLGKKRGSALGQSRDNYVLIPITTFQKGYGSSASVVIWGKANTPARLDATIDQVRQVLRGIRHVRYAAKDDFTIDTNASFLAVWGSLTSTFFGVIVLIASIALVVGGIVIMNIMLVSVTERTREIGLRKSLGARRHDIRMQFLVESSTIAAVGGICGILGGVFLAKLVSWVTPLPSAIEAWSVIAGFVVATSVGLFFGIYPASKAARLDPVVALRQE